MGKNPGEVGKKEIFFSGTIDGGTVVVVGREFFLGAERTVHVIPIIHPGMKIFFF